MTLRNLLGISLEAVDPDAAGIARLLEAAGQSLADARLGQLSKQRNAIDYSGDLVSPSMSAQAVAQAESLLEQVRDWLRKNRPDLFIPG